MKKAAISILLITLPMAVMTACGDSKTVQPQGATPAVTAAAADIITEDANWVDAYDAVLNGENELGIDFRNYEILDETDVTKNRVYKGCGLYDLDGNGIPELFVNIWLWEGGFYHVFTADNGEGKYVGDAMGNMIEKSTGVLFGFEGETGYTPNIAYEYTGGSLVEIPGYVQSIPENYSEVVLGEKTAALQSDDIIMIEAYDSLEEAVENYGTPD